MGASKNSLRQLVFAVLATLLFVGVVCNLASSVWANESLQKYDHVSVPSISACLDGAVGVLEEEEEANASLDKKSCFNVIGIPVLFCADDSLEVAQYFQIESSTISASSGHLVFLSVRGMRAPPSVA